MVFVRAHLLLLCVALQGPGADQAEATRKRGEGKAGTGSPGETPAVAGKGTCCLTTKVST